MRDRWISCGILGVAMTIASAAALARNMDSEAIDGRVRHSGDGAFDVCFDRAAHASIGDRLIVIRHELVPPNAKATPMIRASDVGAGDIVSMDGNCATARLTEGKAAALDWISLAR